MRRVSAVRIFEILLSFAGMSLFIWAWISHVQPFPDRDSVHQFLFPVLNYLKASSQLGNDFLYLNQVMLDKFPTGILALPWLVSLVGLQELFLSSPWLFDFFLLIPLCIAAWLAPVPASRRWLFLCLLFFFPPVQVALKNLNLHSFTIISCLAGIFLFQDYRRSSSKGSLIAAVLFFWFSCAVKHLGVILFLDLWLVYLLWLRRRGESLTPAVMGGILILCLSIPFYPLDGFLPYLESLIRTNPNLNPIWIYAMFGSGLFLMLFAWFQGVTESFGRSETGISFARIWFFVLNALVVLFIVCMGSDFHGLTWLLLCFIAGNGVLVAFLRWRQFETERGLVILAFLLLSVTALVFYFSMLGQISAFFVLPLLLLLLLIVREAKSTLRPWILAGVFVLASNFFPALHELESLFGSGGFFLYAKGFNMLHQNPLGWQRSGISRNRDDLRRILEAYRFKVYHEPVALLRHGIHHHIAVELTFPEQYLYEIPPMELVDQMSSEKSRAYYHLYLSDREFFFTSVAQAGEIPLMISGRNLYTRYEGNGHKADFPVAEAENEARMLSASSLQVWFHDAYFRFLKEREYLEKYYRKHSIGEDPQSLTIFVHKKIEENSSPTGESPRLASLLLDYREYRDPGLKKARELFLRSNSYFDQKRFLEAYVLLKSATEMAPNHQEIRKDLENAYGGLREWEKEILEKYPQPKLFQILEEGDSLPWRTEKDWYGSTPGENEIDEALVKKQQEAQDLFDQSSRVFSSEPKEARKFLERVLELDPNHPEARKDLEILNSVPVPDPAVLEAKSIEADALFNQSTKYFVSDPLKASELLKKVLTLNPTHTQALEDLKVIEARPEKGESGSMTPQSLRALGLFNQASELFEANPKKALKLLRKVIELDPFHENAIKDLSVLTQAVNRNKAAELYHKSLLYQSNDPRYAASLLQEVILLDPDHSVAKRDHAKIQAYLESDSMQKARARLLASQGKSIVQTNPTEALKLFKRVLKLDPANEEAREYLKKLSGSPNPAIQ